MNKILLLPLLFTAQLLDARCWCIVPQRPPRPAHVTFKPVVRPPSTPMPTPQPPVAQPVQPVPAAEHYYVIDVAGVIPGPVAQPEIMPAHEVPVVPPVEHQEPQPVELVAPVTVVQEPVAPVSEPVIVVELPQPAISEVTQQPVEELATLPEPAAQQPAEIIVPVIIQEPVAPEQPAQQPTVIVADEDEQAGTELVLSEVQFSTARKVALVLGSIGSTAIVVCAIAARRLLILKRASNAQL